MVYYITYADYGELWQWNPHIDTSTYYGATIESSILINDESTTVYSSTNTTVYSGVSIGTTELSFRDTYYTYQINYYIATIYLETYQRNVTTSTTAYDLRPYCQIAPTPFADASYFVTTTSGSFYTTSSLSSFETALISDFTATYYFNIPTYTYATLTTLFSGVNITPNSVLFSYNGAFAPFINTVVFNVQGDSTGEEIICWFTAPPGASGFMSDLMSSTDGHITLHGSNYNLVVSSRPGGIGEITTSTANYGAITHNDNQSLFATNVYWAGPTYATSIERDNVFYPFGLSSYLPNGLIEFSPYDLNVELRGRTTVSFDIYPGTWVTWSVLDSSMIDVINSTLTSYHYFLYNTSGWFNFPGLGLLPGTQPYPFNFYATNMSALAPFSQTNLDTVYRGLVAEFVGNLGIITSPLDLRPLFSSVRPGQYSIMLNQRSTLESFRSFWIEPDETTSTSFISTILFNLLSYTDTAATLEATAIRTQETTFETTNFTDHSTGLTTSEVASGSILINLTAPCDTSNLVSYKVGGWEGDYYLGSTLYCQGGNMGVGTEQVINFPPDILQPSVYSVTRNSVDGISITYTTMWNTTYANNLDELTFASHGFQILTLANSIDPYHEGRDVFYLNKYFATDIHSESYRYNGRFPVASAHRKSIYKSYYTPLY